MARVGRSRFARWQGLAVFALLAVLTAAVIHEVLCAAAHPVRSSEGHHGAQNTAGPLPVSAPARPQAAPGSGASLGEAAAVWGDHAHVSPLAAGHEHGAIECADWFVGLARLDSATLMSSVMALLGLLAVVRLSLPAAGSSSDYRRRHGRAEPGDGQRRLALLCVLRN